MMRTLLFVAISLCIFSINAGDLPFNHVQSTFMKTKPGWVLTQESRDASEKAKSSWAIFSIFRKKKSLEALHRATIREVIVNAENTKNMLENSLLKKYDGDDEIARRLACRAIGTFKKQHDNTKSIYSLPVEYSKNDSDNDGLETNHPTQTAQIDINFTYGEIKCAGRLKYDSLVLMADLIGIGVKAVEAEARLKYWRAFKPDLFGTVAKKLKQKQFCNDNYYNYEKEKRAYENKEPKMEAILDADTLNINTTFYIENIAPAKEISMKDVTEYYGNDKEDLRLTQGSLTEEKNILDKRSVFIKLFFMRQYRDINKQIERNKSLTKELETDYQRICSISLNYQFITKHITKHEK